MRRIARIGTGVAIVGLSVGMWTGTTDLFIAATAFFVGAAGVTCAMFGWFRVADLRERQESRH